MEQKYFRGHRVKIAEDLGPSMAHFTGDCEAIVIGSYSDQFGGDNDDSYSLLLLTEQQYSVSWYREHKLTLLSIDGDEGERLLQKYKNC